jgi:predicted lipid-binding transport protein (Tim44 family)
MVDIIIFALITAFLLWKLKGVLGKEEEGSKRNIVSSIKDITGMTKEIPQNLIELKKEQKEKRKFELEEEIKINLEMINPKFETAYKVLSNALPTGPFDLKNFLNNIEGLFTTLIESRDKKDLTELISQVSPEVFNMLANFIEEERVKNPHQKMELVKINSIQIAEFNAFEDGSALIKVIVLSEQIRYVKDGENIISGSITIPSKFSDLLTIERVSKNKQYSWILTKIE